MSEELKPCPFCGGKAHVDHIDKGWNVWFVQCNTRGCAGRGDDFKFDSGSSCAVGYEMAIKAWNTRHEPEVKEVLTADDYSPKQIKND